MSRNKVLNNLDAVKDLFEVLGLEDEHVVGIGVNMGAVTMHLFSHIYVRHKAYLLSVGYEEKRLDGNQGKLTLNGISVVTQFD